VELTGELDGVPSSGPTDRIQRPRHEVEGWIEICLARSDPLGRGQGRLQTRAEVCPRAPRIDDEAHRVTIRNPGLLTWMNGPNLAESSFAGTTDLLLGFNLVTAISDCSGVGISSLPVNDRGRQLDGRDRLLIPLQNCRDGPRRYTRGWGFWLRPRVWISRRRIH
jgi:hypothetical protein